MTDHRADSSDDQPFAGLDPSPEVGRSVSRRELLRLGLVGGSAALVSQQVTQRLGESRAADQRIALETDLRVRMGADLEGAQARIRRLEQELALYRALERTQLDKLITLLLDSWDAVWRSVRDVVLRLRGGVESADRTLREWDERLALLSEAARWWGGLLDGVEEQLEAVRTLLGTIIQRTGPIGETVKGFFDWLLERIPFGWGSNLRDGAQSVTSVMTSLPLLLQDSREKVLQPLAEDWIADEGGLRGGLFAPLRAVVLAPLQAHLAYLEGLASDWEQRTAAPLRQAISEREAVHSQIAALQAADPVAFVSEPPSESPG